MSDLFWVVVVLVVLNLTVLALLGFGMIFRKRSVNQDAEALSISVTQGRDTLNALNRAGEELVAKISELRSAGVDTGSVSDEARQLTTDLQNIQMNLSKVQVNQVPMLITELNQQIAVLQVASRGDPSNPREQMANWLIELKTKLEKEWGVTQSGVDEAARLALNLRKENKAVFSSGSALETLRQVNERLFDNMKTMRERVRLAEDRAASATLEAAEMKVNARQGTLTSDQQSLFHNLNQRLMEMENERSDLAEKLQDSEDNMNRNLREKALIEQKYLELVVEVETLQNASSQVDALVPAQTN